MSNNGLELSNNNLRLKKIGNSGWNTTAITTLSNEFHFKMINIGGDGNNYLMFGFTTLNINLNNANNYMTCG